MIGRLLPIRDKKRDYTPYNGPKRRAGRARKHFPPAFEPPSKTNGHFKPEIPIASLANTKKPLKQKTPRKLSPLETLPIELLQTIFVDSMNVALPCASPQLAVKLSSEHLQLEMSMRMLYLRFKIASKRDRSQLLMRRFFTLDFLVKYVQHAHSYWVCKEAKEKDLKYLKKRSHYTEGNLSKLSISSEEAHWIAENWDQEWSHLPYIMGLSDLHIPEKLLHGPWTDTRCSYLQVLCKRGNGIDWFTPSATEVVEKGVTGAILGSSDRAVSNLIDHDPEVRRVRPTHAMLRRSVLEGGCNKTIVTIILGDELEDDGGPKHDPENKRFNYLDADLWAWIEKQGRRDEKAEWLEKVLKSSGQILRGHH